MDMLGKPLNGYHLELLKTKRYISLSEQSEKMTIKIAAGIIHGVSYDTGDSVPVCIDGIKISEAKVIETNLTYTVFGILLNSHANGFVPEFTFINSEYISYGAVNFGLIKNHVKDIFGYEGFPYVRLNVRWKKKNG